MKQHLPPLHPFGNQIANEKKRLEALAAELAPGQEHEDILQKIRQLHTADRIDEWLSSPGLQAPT
jgi:hypothetical protein